MLPLPLVHCQGILVFMKAALKNVFHFFGSSLGSVSKRYNTWEHVRLQDIWFLFFSVGIGLLAACGALLFRELISLFQHLFWGGDGTFLKTVSEAPWWMLLLVPTLGGLVCGPIIVFFAPEARGPGVPEVIVAVASQESTIRHRVTALKALVSSLLIGAGASVGREGPIVQIGASVGSSIAQMFKLNPNLRRVCLASGAAAGIAATFNAPIAGTLFAIEIILLDIEVAYISHIIVASVVGSTCSRIFWGDFLTFLTIPFSMASRWELIAFLALGIIAGLTAILFVRSSSLIEDIFNSIPIPAWLKPALGGLLLGTLGIFIPEVMGVGYDSINLALAGTMGLTLAALLVFAKTLATSLSIGSGMSGGIFAPSLVLGAALGTAVAMAGNKLLVANGMAPIFVPAHYALAGMGAVVSGTTLAPITAIITIFELTYSTKIILPLMLACIGSATVVRLLFGYSVYEMKMLRQGINIVRGHDVGVLRNLHVVDFMHKVFNTLHPDTPYPKIVDAMSSLPFPHCVVTGDAGHLEGVLSLRDLREHIGKYEESLGLTAADLMTADVHTLSPSTNLEQALLAFEQYHISFMPVVDPVAPSIVVGIVKRDDMLHAYRERVLKNRLLSPAPKKE